MMLKHFLPAVALLIVADLHLAGCASAEKNPFTAPETVVDQVAADQKKMILAGEAALSLPDYALALEQFDVYLKKYPLSVYTAQAQLGRGRALEGLDRTEEAIAVYRLVGEQARSQSPEQAGAAYLRLAYCYERLGDEGRLQLALKDAEAFGEALPDDVRLIEIPTRKAASDLRRGEAEAARKLLKKVEENLPAVNSQSPAAAQDRQAQLLLGMGSMNVNDLAAENYLPKLESFEALQRYLWRSYAMNRRPHSEEALSKLHEAYYQFANQAFNPPRLKSGRSAEVAERARRDLQRRWISRLLESLQNLRSYSEDRAADPATEFGKLVAQIETGGEKILRRGTGPTPLTPESKARNQLKREGTTQSAPLFESEKAAVGQGAAAEPAPSKEDPNLKSTPTGATETPENP